MMRLKKGGYSADLTILKGHYQGLKEIEIIFSCSYEPCVALEAGCFDRLDIEQVALRAVAC
jgi:hypothetical protein